MNVFLWNARARNTHVEATLNHPFPAQVGANECEPEVRQFKEPKKKTNWLPRLKTLHLTWDVPGADDIKAGFHWLEMADDIRNMAAGDRLDARVNATILVINVGLHIDILAKDACEAVVARTEQGRKRVRKSQLQRLLSRSFSTRFG